MSSEATIASGKKNIKTILKQLESEGIIGISVDCVIFGFDENELKVLLIKSDLEKFKNKWSLLGDLINKNEDLREAAYRILEERTGLRDVYLEQVKAFGEAMRHPAARVVTIAYCSLINIQHHQLKILDNELHWHKIKSIDEMAFDHKKILTVCYEWLQKRIQEHPLGFSLLPGKFSLRELQNLYEAILNIKLDRRNFRKKFFSMGLLEDTQEYETDVPHRPGKLYKFNYEKYQKKERKKWFGIDF
ncbi:MAG: NUDIX hydrolase [Bacteroidetes bacterium]|nr:NUDIX hydrolase [Bacteroidota bacterium]MBS1935560.1 NUDIX hydrolase [Bacteroidota bacterium]